MPRQLSRSSRVLAVAVALLCAGCGPFGYLKKVATDATRAVADAEAAEAEKYAPYEYWGAVAYLEQSKVLMGYSEYERSFDFGERAKQLANEAKVKAKQRKEGKTVLKDENIAAPGDLVDAEGNPVDAPKDPPPAAEDKPAEDKPAEGKVEAGGKAKAGKGSK